MARLVEVKSNYCGDTRPGQQLEAAQQQNADLCIPVSAKAVTLHTILLGVGETCHMAVPLISKATGAGPPSVSFSLIKEWRVSSAHVPFSEVHYYIRFPPTRSPQGVPLRGHCLAGS
eukprot:845569-Pelagomonas_calceolata.AAC.1